jgi:hypothetical protein
MLLVAGTGTGTTTIDGSMVMRGWHELRPSGAIR